MGEAGDKLTDDERKPVNEALESLKEAVKEKKYDELDTLMKTVTDFWYPLASKMYGQQQA
jgi:molecular chaperone DnaK